MRYWIGRGFMLAGILTSMFALYLGMSNTIRPGRELMILVGSMSFFMIGWIVAGGGKK